MEVLVVVGVEFNPSGEVEWRYFLRQRILWDLDWVFFFWEVPRDEIKEKNWMKNKKNMGREKSNNDREGT